MRLCRSHKCILAVLIAAFTAMGGMLYVGQKLARRRLPAYLSQQLTAALKRDVSIGKVVFWPPGVFTVKRIEVGGDPGEPDPLLKARRARAYISWWDLLARRQLRVTAFHIDGAHVRTTIDLRKPAITRPNLTEQLLALTQYGIREVGIHKSTADVTTILPNGDRRPVSATGLDAVAALRPAGFRFDARARQWSAAGLTAQDLMFSGRGDRKSLTLTRSSARFQGGNLAANGTYLTDQGSVAMRVRVRDMPLTNLAAQFGLPTGWNVRGGLTGVMDLTVSSGALRHAAGTLNVARGSVAHGANVLPWRSATAALDWRPDRMLLQGIDVRGDGLRITGSGKVEGSASMPFTARPFSASGRVSTDTPDAAARLAALVAFSEPVKGQWSVNRGTVDFTAHGAAGNLQQARSEGRFVGEGVALKVTPGGPPLRITSVRGDLSRFPTHLHLSNVAAQADGLALHGGVTVTPNRGDRPGVFAAQGTLDVRNLRTLHAQLPAADFWKWIDPTTPQSHGRFTFEARGPNASPWHTAGVGSFQFRNFTANLPIGVNGAATAVPVRTVTGKLRLASNRMALQDVKLDSDLLTGGWNGVVGDVKRGRDVRGTLRLASSVWERIPLLQQAVKAGLAGGAMVAEFRVDPALQAKGVTAGNLVLRGASYRTTAAGKPKILQVQAADASFRIAQDRVDVPRYRLVTPEFRTVGRGYGLRRARNQWALHARGEMTADNAEALAKFWSGAAPFTGGRMSARYAADVPPGGGSDQARVQGHVLLTDAQPAFPPGSLPVPAAQAHIDSLTGDFALAGKDLAFRNLDWRSPLFRATGDGTVRRQVLDGVLRITTQKWRAIAGELAKGLPVAGGTLALDGRLVGRTDALKQALLDGTVTLTNARLASDRNASMPVEGGALDLKARVKGPLGRLVGADIQGSFTLRNLTLPGYRKGLARARINLAGGKFDRNGARVRLTDLAAEGPIGRLTGSGELRGVGTGHASHEFSFQAKGPALALALPALTALPGKATGGSFTGSLNLSGTAAHPVARMEGRVEVRNARWIPPKQTLSIEIERAAAHYLRTGDTAVIDNTDLRIKGGEATLAGTLQGLDTPRAMRYQVRVGWRLEDASGWAARFLPLPGKFTGGLFTGTTQLAGSVKQPVTSASGEFSLKDTGFLPLARFLGGPVKPVQVSEARGIFRRVGSATRLEKLVLNTSIGTAAGTVAANQNGAAKLDFRGEISRLEALVDLWPSFNGRIKGGRAELLVSLQGPLKRPRDMRGTVDISGSDGELTVTDVSPVYAVHPFTRASAHLVLDSGGAVRIESMKMRGPKANLDGAGSVASNGAVHMEGKAWFTSDFTRKVFKPKFLYPLAKLFGWGKIKSGYEVNGTLQEARLRMGITRSAMWKLGIRDQVPKELRRIATGDAPLWEANTASRAKMARH